MKLQRLFTDSNPKKPVSSGWAQIRKQDDRKDFEKHLDRKIKTDKYMYPALSSLAGGVLSASIAVAKNPKKAVVSGLAGAGVAGLSTAAIRKAAKIEEKEKVAKEELLNMYDSLPHRGYKAESERRRFREEALSGEKSFRKLLKEKKNK